MFDPHDVKTLARLVESLYPAVYQRFHASRQLIPGSEVTIRMLGVLRHLAMAGPLTLGELTNHLGLKKATVTELIDRLEERKMVERMRDDRDRRRVFLWLTEKGQEKAAENPHVLENSKLEGSLRRMTTEERLKLVEGLEALLRAEHEEVQNESQLH